MVVNPRATTTTPGTREVLIHALRSELEIDVAYTKRRGHAAELARQAVADGRDLVVALGGDGTVNEVVNGLLPPPGERRPSAADIPALAVVPGGSANVLARALGLARSPVEAMAQILTALREGRTRTIGLGGANDQWFTFSAGLGFDAEAIRRVERARVRGRTASWPLYVGSAIAQYFSATDRSQPLIQVRRSDGTALPPLAMLIVQNTTPWTYLGSQPVSTTKTASFDTGLDLFGLRQLRTVSTLAALAQTISHGQEPRGRQVYRLRDVTGFVVSCRRPLALQLDGDYMGEADELTFTSVPSALRVVI